MGNYLGFFSSCTSFVHVVEKPLRIYRILRILASLCLFCYVPFSYTAPTRLLRIYRILRIFRGCINISSNSLLINLSDRLDIHLVSDKLGDELGKIYGKVNYFG